MPNISIIICTHNPRPDYLARVFEALKAQTLPKEEWELLLVDNASIGRLSEIWGLSWHPRARHIREDELGLTPARLRGIRESCGDLLVFIDDDNVLAPDYLQTAHALLVEHPYLGVIGAGILEPEFEMQPPPELFPHLGRLALRRVSTALWSNNTNDNVCVPWGAGLCVTRRIAESYQQLVKQLNVTELLDRRGEHLFGEGDIAFSWASVAGGQGFGVFPTLHVIHLISADRLNHQYFLRLVHDSSFSGGVLNYLRAGIPPSDSHSGKERYLRMILHGIKNGLFSMRVRWAASRGSDRANLFVTEKRLRPLDQDSLPRQLP